MSNQGASGVLNEYIQGDDRMLNARLTHADIGIDGRFHFIASYFDHSRNILLIINHFRGKMPRPLVGIVHSMSCAQL